MLYCCVIDDDVNGIHYQVVEKVMNAYEMVGLIEDKMMMKIGILLTKMKIVLSTPSVPPISLHFPLWAVPSNSLHFKTYQK